jgi:L-amino acid N-acyltransferase YncA
MAGEHSIREATIKDAPGITEIFNDVIANTVFIMDTEPKTLENRIEWIQNHNKLGRYPILVLAI